MTEPQYVTKADLDAALSEHRDAIRELREATTAQGRDRASTAVDDAEDSLETIAKKLGVKSDDLDRMLDEQEYTRIRKHFQRFETEREAERKARDDKGDKKKAAKKAPKKETATGEASDDDDADDDDKRKPDSAPSEPQPHWSERSVGSLIGLGE